ncbi:uncharacterized protein (DUF952 family) [Spirosoma oryzae]|uniref:Uncharacterized protein (DUF952 family) n=1 Tax=Spirosoma oryzae TaxID=1469603 RepID=A0A2T0T5N7_9BACT|nr:DUF952 domain-containing protein [Spirosoma oryzae]PRY40976.1 uncharacterized protein (DUF952 family) [Spirosoma oryzae]
MSRIYHVVTTADWAAAENQPTYEAGSLQTEGFIHASERGQVAGVLERYYKDVPDLLLLHIDPAKLTAELRYEVATNNELFPHIYGPINREAVVDVETIDRTEQA